MHILGDLEDVKNLVSGVNRKKTIVIFRDGDQEIFYLESEGEFKIILPNDIAYLEKKYRLIFFSFFPSRKKVEELAEEKPVMQEPENPQIQIPNQNEKKGKKKEKNNKNDDKVKNENKKKNKKKKK